jgi:hypothetical protein
MASAVARSVEIVGDNNIIISQIGVITKDSLLSSNNNELPTPATRSNEPQNSKVPTRVVEHCSLLDPPEYHPIQVFQREHTGTPFPTRSKHINFVVSCHAKS